MSRRKVWNLIGAVVGICILIFGLARLNDPPSFLYPDSVEFGGDFQTYQYKVTKYAAQNVSRMGQNVSENFAYLFIVTGALATVYYGKAFFCDEDKPTTEASQSSQKFDELPPL